MKTSKLFRLALLAVSLCFTACDGLNTSNPSTPSIRPQTIDLTGVQGFAIVENTSNASRTKADTNGDGVDDDMPNGNAGEVANTSPYALYTIDKNGELHASIFYFEVVPSEDGSTDTPNTEVLKEISNALQVVPSLVTNLGKYILFSGCEYHIVDTEISDDALSICEIFIQQNYKPNMVYLIRKADGALFDLTDRFFFCYTADNDWNAAYYTPHYEGSGYYIPSATYLTSQQNNLFILGSQPLSVYKVEDNGDAVDFRQLTQQLESRCMFFSIDATENIYIAELYTIVR